MKEIKEKLARLRHGIAAKFFLYIFLFSFITTFIATAFQLYQEYRKDLEQIDEQFHEIETSHLPALLGTLLGATTGVS